MHLNDAPSFWGALRFQLRPKDRHFTSQQISFADGLIALNEQP
jgi:hypothetical protein